MKRSFIFGLILSIATLMTACATVPAYKQQHVSKTGMTFSDNPTENNRVNLLSQLESGSSISGGAQAAGCTACR
ncbi:MAG: hypothetical protein AAGB46_15265 [Verrucomicrobiota bacterium]